MIRAAGLDRHIAMFPMALLEERKEVSMPRIRPCPVFIVRRAQWLAACFALACLPLLTAATKQAVKKPTYEPNLNEVELFDALDRGLVEATVIPKSALQANLFVTNKSGAPLSVKIPEAVVAVHVLKQFFPPGGAQGPAAGQAGGSNAQGGGAQTVGGGVQSGQGNGNGNGIANRAPFGQGNFFFSIASDKTIQLPLKTVCLSHGKPDPRPKMTYRLVKVEEYTTDPVLPEVLKAYVKGEADAQVAQAAAWHLSDKLSWHELAEKNMSQLGGFDPKPYFTEKQIKAAQDLITKVRAEVKAKQPAQVQAEKKI